MRIRIAPTGNRSAKTSGAVTACVNFTSWLAAGAEVTVEAEAEEAIAGGC